MDQKERYRMTIVIDEPVKQLLQYHACRKAEDEGICDSLSTTVYKILWRTLRKAHPEEASRLKKKYKLRRTATPRGNQ